jgi:hypothetical protein
MKKILWLFTLLFPISLLAQEEFTTATRSQSSIDLGFSGLQIATELKTAKTQTVQFRGGIVPLFYTETNFINGNKYVELMASISLSAEYRFYYNFERRKEKGKDIRNNGANYFSILAMYYSTPVFGKPAGLDVNSNFWFGPVWGFNRPLGDKFLFNLTLGPMVEKEFNVKNTVITLYADLRWSLLLN